MTLFHHIPFLRILVFLVAGILMQRHLDARLLDYHFLCGLFLTLASLLFISYQFWHRRYSLRWIPGLTLSLLVLLTGIILSLHKTPQKLDTTIATKGIGIITTVEYRDNNRFRFTLQPESFQQPTSLREKDKLLLMVQGPLPVLPKEGDRLLFNADIHPLPSPTNPSAFDYGQYLQNNGFLGQAYLYSEDIVIEPSQQIDFRILPSIIRSKCLTVFKNSGVSDTALVVIQALLLGDRSAMDPELQDSFIKSGAVHLLAVSGLHVGILYMVLGSVLSLFFKPSNVISIILSLGFLFAYAFITGFSPSVSRAALMFGVIHLGRVSNQSTNIYNSLAVSASLLLIINPLFLFHVGYWLTHLAVLGIVVFYPIINGLLTFRFIIWRHLWSITAVSLAAQFATFPVSLYTFGAFPTWFLLSNMLMLPLVAPILVLAIATLIFGFSPVLSAIFAGGLNDLLLFVTDMAVAIENLPNGYLEYLWLSFPLVIICYIAIYQTAQLCYRRKGQYWVGLTASILALVVGLNIQLHRKLNNDQIVIYDTNHGLLIDIIEKGNVLTIESDDINKRTKQYARNAYVKQYRKHHQSERIITLESETLTQIIEVSLDWQRLMVANGKGTIFPSEAYKPEIVVLSGAISMNLMQLIEKTNCKTIVAASTCPYPLLQKWKKETETLPVTFHSVKEDGAYISQNRKN